MAWPGRWVLPFIEVYDKEIAERLAISPATVKMHLNRIYGKLGVTNRREAARKGKRLGLI